MNSRAGSKLAAAVGGLMITLGLAAAASAQVVRPEEVAEDVALMPLAQLERRFWLCDYLGTTRGAEGADAPRCVAISDALRRRRFGDDLDRLVAWWREHKSAEYARFATLERGSIDLARH